MKTNRAGFSLFEAIVYMAIMSVLLVTILTIVVQSMTTRTKAMVMQNVTYETQFVLDRLTTDIRAAVAISSIDLAANILTITLADGSIHRYEQQGTRIMFRRNNQPPVTLTSADVAVSEFVVSNRTTVGSDVQTIGIALTVDSVTHNPRPEFNASQSLTTTVTTRYENK